jgi:hypothetical protein
MTGRDLGIAVFHVVAELALAGISLVTEEALAWG